MLKLSLWKKNEVASEDLNFYIEAKIRNLKKKTDDCIIFSVFMFLVLCPKIEITRIVF